MFIFKTQCSVSLWALPVALFSALLGAGCSLSSQNSPALHLDLSALQDRSFSLQDSRNFLSFAAPASLSGFACYGVNVTGPGIADSSGHSEQDPMIDFQKAITEPDYSCSYRGVITRPLSPGGPLEVNLPVPPGPVRLVQVVGVTDAAICQSGVLGSNDGGPSGGSRYFEVGRAVMRDFYTDASVAISLDWPAAAADQAKRSLECGDGGDCGNLVDITHAAPTEILVSTTTQYLALKLPTTPGKYIDSAKLVLRGQVGGSSADVDAKVQIFEAITAGGLGDPTSTGTIYSKTVTIGPSAQGEPVSFDFKHATNGYLQMVAGKHYWIVFSVPNAAGSVNFRKIYVSTAGSATQFGGPLSSWSGSTWVSEDHNDGFVSSVLGCGN